MYISLTVKMWYFICILYVYCVAVHVAYDNVKINENTTTITTTTDLGTTRKNYKHGNIATNVQWGWGAGGVVDFLPTACTEVWLAHAGCAMRIGLGCCQFDMSVFTKDYVVVISSENLE